MRRATRTPEIPLPSEDNVLEAVVALKEVVEVREGRRGDGLDKAVTLRDLETLGIVQRPEDAQWTAGYSAEIGGLPVVVPPWVNPVPWAGDNYDPNTDFSVPPAPANLIASGSYASVNLSWIYPTYRNHGYTEIWRSSVNSLATAALVGVNQATVYNDPVGTEKKYYYWVRNVSKADVKSEYNSLTGTYAETAEDVARRVDELESAVLGDGLTRTLSERIFALESTQGSLSQSLTSLTATTASKTDLLTNVVNQNSTSIQTQQTITEGLRAQYTVKIDANGYVSGFGLASELVNDRARSSFTVLADRFAIVNPNVDQITVSSASVSVGTAIIIVGLTRTGTTATAVCEIAHDFVVGQMVRVVTSTANWTGNYKVVSTPDGSTFTFVVDSTLATPAANGTVRAWATGTIVTAVDHGLSVGDTFVINRMGGDTRWNGSWTVASVTNTTTFTFSLPPNYSTAPVVAANTTIGKSSVPFVVDEGKVYIDTALIKNATITSAMIGSLAADKITTGNLTATVNVTTGTVKSSASYGQAGFWLGSDGGTQKFYVGDGSNKYLSWDGANLSVRGTVYADAGSFAGTISASAGLIGGITINANNLQSSNYVANTSGWQITSAGAAQFNNITARGITIYNSSGQVLLSSGGNIDGTYISNATIGTLSLINGAVTVPVAGTQASTVTYYGNGFGGATQDEWTADPSTQIYKTLASVTIDFGSVTGNKAIIGLTFQVSSGGGGEWGVIYRVGRSQSGTNQGYFTGLQGIGNNQTTNETISTVFFNDSLTGQYTYTLEASLFGSIGADPGTGVARTITGGVVYVMGTKR